MVIAWNTAFQEVPDPERETALRRLAQVRQNVMQNQNISDLTQILVSKSQSEYIFITDVTKRGRQDPSNLVLRRPLVRKRFIKAIAFSVRFSSLKHISLLVIPVLAQTYYPSHIEGHGVSLSATIGNIFQLSDC